jgi:mannose-6-phosphate isomerase-like protein (cupin superfamily)
MIPLSIKLSSEDTGGNLFVFEHKNMGKGGPPRHVHHEQDEWFYAVKGEFLVEIGGETFRLLPGDSLFAPRQIGHG